MNTVFPKYRQVAIKTKDYNCSIPASYDSKSAFFFKQICEDTDQYLLIYAGVKVQLCIE